MAKISDLQSAKSTRNDEYYTLYRDIEKECKHYSFKDKVVYCNCDDPRSSNFWRYFYENFSQLGLKKLMATFKAIDEKPFFTSYDGSICEECKNSGTLPYRYTERKYLSENGSFDSEECLNYMKNADIIVTNPPFSMLKTYIKTLFLYGKKFLIIGHINAISYKEVFPLIRDNKMWMGVSIHSGDREFLVPEKLADKATLRNFREDEEGNLYVKVQGVRWFTNLDHNYRQDYLTLIKDYNPVLYPKYINFDAINVDKVSDIPKDYKGIIGVPISYLDKHNPNDFKIIGLGQGKLFRDLSANGLSAQFVKDYFDSGQKGNIRPNHAVLGYYKDGKPVIPYMRLLIQKL